MINDRLRFWVKPSLMAGAGRGVFTRKAMAKGENLHVAGVLVRRGSLADRCTHYADPYKFRVGSDLLIPTGYAAFVNHSLQPNLAKRIIGKKVHLRALRAIRSGEELSLRYGKDAVRRFRKPS